MSLSQSLLNDVNPEESTTGKEQPLSDEYKQEVFVIWYNRQKPNAQALAGFIPNDKYTGDRASLYTLKRWISNEFALKAAELDVKVADQMDQTLVQSKLEMLQRHASLGKEMQELALKYIKETKKEDLGSVRNAITLLVKGVQIEHESLSLPKFLSEMADKTDEELIEDIRKLAQGDGVIDLEAEDLDDR